MTNLTIMTQSLTLCIGVAAVRTSICVTPDTVYHENLYTFFTIKCDL